MTFTAECERVTGNRTHRDTSEKAKDAVNRFVAPSVPLTRRHITVPR